jgi:hypothetical protein
MKNIIAKSTQEYLTIMEPHLHDPQNYADFMRTLIVSCLSRLQDHPVAEIKHETISPILKKMATEINLYNQTKCDPFLFELGCCLVKQANINTNTAYARAVRFLNAQRDGKEPPRIFPPHVH